MNKPQGFDLTPDGIEEIEFINPFTDYDRYMEKKGTLPKYAGTPKRDL